MEMESKDKTLTEYIFHVFNSLTYIFSRTILSAEILLGSVARPEEGLD
jgi:hypothetical protein